MGYGRMRQPLQIAHYLYLSVSGGRHALNPAQLQVLSFPVPFSRCQTTHLSPSSFSFFCIDNRFACCLLIHPCLVLCLHPVVTGFSFDAILLTNISVLFDRSSLCFIFEGYGQHGFREDCEDEGFEEGCP